MASHQQDESGKDIKIKPPAQGCRAGHRNHVSRYEQPGPPGMTATLLSLRPMLQMGKGEILTQS